jgi:hypothetical protein
MDDSLESISGALTRWAGEVGGSSLRMIEHWVELPPRPDWGVGIDDRDDRVVPIPDEVRERSTGVRNSTVVRATHDRRGILSDRTQVSWDASPSDCLALRFQRPAKGSGHISSSIAPERAPS